MGSEMLLAIVKPTSAVASRIAPMVRKNCVCTALCICATVAPRYRPRNRTPCSIHTVEMMNPARIAR